MMKTRGRQATLTVPIGGRDHIQGPLDAPAKLLEYGDYQCPYCGEAFSIVKAIQRRMGDNLCFAFRHFPLTTIHPYAEGAAEAAEAAGAQGKFWQMHDALYENQDALDYQHLLLYAEQLGLDMQPFADDLARHAYLERIREDFISGVRSGVNGTPTFFINGVRHEGSYDFAALYEAIEAHVKGMAA
jgi:protein-disulfide isomerase